MDGARICKRLRSPGIDSKEPIPPAFVAWRAGTSDRVVVPARQAGNRFLGSLKGLKIRALLRESIQSKAHFRLQYPRQNLVFKILRHCPFKVLHRVQKGRPPKHKCNNSSGSYLASHFKCGERLKLSYCCNTYILCYTPTCH